MNTPQPRNFYPATQFFTLRLWVETFGAGQGEIRMQVKHILSGETRYFRDWLALHTYLEEKMQETDSKESS